MMGEGSVQSGGNPVTTAVTSAVPSTTMKVASAVRFDAPSQGPVSVPWTTIDEAVVLANEFAAEHVLLAVRDPERVLERLRGAGTVFVGQASSVAFGDYMTGANHVLPTGGLARSYSGLSVLDYFRWTTYQRVSPAAAARLSSDVATFAMSEGLPGHAVAARAWGTA